MEERHVDACARRVLAGDADERAADVEPGYGPWTEPGELDRQIARAGRNLEDGSRGLKSIGDAVGERGELVGAARGVSSVPAGNEALHRHAPVGLHVRS